LFLGDGSLVTLNTSSSIEVHMAKDRRTVKLLAGEALFEVAHDTKRPFDVTTGDATVRAIARNSTWTAAPPSTTVTVVEGRVALFTTPDGTQQGRQTTLPLGAGEQLTLAPRSAATLCAPMWRQRLPGHSAS